MIIVILYAIIGVLAAFSFLVWGKVHDIFDEVGQVLGPLVMVLAWPVALPLGLLVLGVFKANIYADKLAKQIRDRR